MYRRFMRFMWSHSRIFRALDRMYRKNRCYICGVRFSKKNPRATDFGSRWVGDECYPCMEEQDEFARQQVAKAMMGGHPTS